MMKELEGIKIREGTWDSVIVGEISSYKKKLDVKGKVVMDIGGCFGAATVMFVNCGAEKVICYEPEPSNFEMVVENTKDFENVIAVNAAVGARTGDTIPFYMNEKGKNKGIGSVFKVRGRKEIRVETISFDEELEKHRPEVLKIDCEGGEYTFLTKPLPDHVKQVCMEIHMTNDDHRAKAIEMIKLFEGWDVVKAPKIGKSDVTLGCWKRA
jgi:FkbM family methyltransferase